MDAGADQGHHYPYLRSILITGGRLMPRIQPRRSMGSNASGQSERTSLPRWTRLLWRKGSLSNMHWVTNRNSNQEQNALTLSSIQCMSWQNVRVWNFNPWCWTLNGFAKVESDGVVRGWKILVWEVLTRGKKRRWRKGVNCEGCWRCRA